MSFDSYGEMYLDFREIDPSYPGWGSLSREMDIAMLDLLDDMLAERKLTDPELRICGDDRCVMWEWWDVAAGTLPNGTKIEIEGWVGQVRPATQHEIEWRLDYEEPRVYATLTPICHYNSYAASPRASIAPHIQPDTVVRAKLPIPLDRGQLLNIIDAEHPPAPAPAKPQPASPARLTRRERQVADMAVAQIPSWQIGARLAITTRTVDNTLGRVYMKLGITGRHQLTREHLDQEGAPRG